MLQDARFALRLFARRPGVTLLVVLTLAIGITASTTVFSLADAILWHPVPFRDPARLVHLRAFTPLQSGVQMTVPVAALDAWPARAGVFASLHTWMMAPAVVGRGGEEEILTVAKLSADLLSDLGVRVQRGRGFEPADVDRRVVIVSDEMRRTQFQDVQDPIGQSIRIDGAAHTIIGVMPPGFAFPVSRIKVWTPYAPPRAGRVRAIARLRPEVTFSQAETFVESTTRGFEEQRHLPEIRIVPLVNPGAATSKAIFIMLAGVACVFLIAVANASNVLLADMVERSGEFAIRRSLGASPLRLGRQLLVETLLRSAAVAIVALLAARLALTAIADGIPRLMSFQSLRPIALDLRSLTFCLALSLVAGCGAALAPFARRQAIDLQTALKGSGRASSRPRVREGLTAIQLAATLVLLVAAGLLVNGFIRLTRVDPGFRASGLSVVSISLPPSRFTDLAVVRQSLDRLQSEATRAPGVVAAALSDGMPPYMNFMALGAIEILGQRAIDKPFAEVSFAAVDPNFFATLQLPIVAGRSFSADDTAGRMQVAVVSRALARALWPDENAIGKQFRPDQSGDPWLTVVGVAGDVVQGGFDAPRGLLTFYTPRAQARQPSTSQTLIVRTATAGSSGSLALLIRRAMPGAVVGAAQTADELIADQHARVRFATSLMSGLAVVALVLALIGVYGAFWSAARQRTREIGVRLAIGASPRDIVVMMLSSSARVATIGLAVGLPVAIAVSRSLRSLLYEVSPADPLTLAVVSAGLLAAALAAAYVPARRGSRVDPTEALRSE